MLRLVPDGCDGAGEEGAGEEGAGEDGAGEDGGVEGLLVTEQLPVETWRPLLAPAVWLTMFGTQDALSRVYAYGTLTLVLDTGFGPAGLLSVPLADHVTLSKM